MNFVDTTTNNAEQELELMRQRDKIIGLQNVNKNLESKIMALELEQYNLQAQIKRVERITTSFPWRLLRKLRSIFKRA